MEETERRTDKKSQSLRSRLWNMQSVGEDQMPLDVDDGLEAPAEPAGNTSSQSEPVSQKIPDPETPDVFSDDLLKIRDAVTDKTIVSVTEARNIRDAVNQADIEDDQDDLLKIRDAVTDKTIVSVTEARNIRDAVNQADIEDDQDDLLKIRDAVTDKTIVSVTEARNIRDAANQTDIEEDSDDLFKIRDAVTDKTIVSVSDAQSVRSAARKIDWESMVPQQDELITPSTGRTEAADEDEQDFDDMVEDFVDDREDVQEDSYPDDRDEEDNGYTDDRYDEEYSDDRYEDDDSDDRAYERGASVRRNRRREEERHYRPAPQQPARRERHRQNTSYYDGYDEYDDYSRGYYDYDDRARYADYSRVKSPLRFIPLVLVIALCVFAFIAARSICFDNPVNTSDYSKVHYEVTADTTIDSLAQDLLSLGLIDNPLVFRLRCFFYSAKLVEGEYELSPSYSTEKIVNILSGYKYGDDE